MARPKDQYEAWIIGQHDTPSEVAAFEHTAEPGEVIVLNTRTGALVVLSAEQFERRFEWV